MKKECKYCNGSGLETDQNGVQKDEPCPICDGRGYLYIDPDTGELRDA
jgi:DnaJ-class molecular chaperone